jgi:hypothetical protein
MDQDIHPTRRLLFKHYVRFSLVQPDSDGVQLDLKQPPLFPAFGSVQHDKDEICRFCRGDHLTAAAASLTSTFNDSWQIEKLNSCAFIFDDSRNSLE